MLVAAHRCAGACAGHGSARRTGLFPTRCRDPSWSRSVLPPSHL